MRPMEAYQLTQRQLEYRSESADPTELYVSCILAADSVLRATGKPNHFCSHAVATRHDLGSL